ncbi:hypothetical protein L7F22_019542 [Adiantum nelumboides]|nr:hypothetical protein [Adiantum nelumboides]
MEDVEAQRQAGQTSSPKSNRSPLGKLPWQARTQSNEEVKKPIKRASTGNQDEANLSNNQPLTINLTDIQRSPIEGSSSNRDASTSKKMMLSPVGSLNATSIPTSATIFSTSDRPELQTMESYAVGRSRTEGGFNSRKDGSSFQRNLFKSPTMKLQRSRSQKRSNSTDERIKSRRSLSKSRKNEVTSPLISPDHRFVASPGSFEFGDIPNKAQVPPAPVNAGGQNDNEEPHETATAMGEVPKPLKQRLSEFHAKYPGLNALPNPLLPIVAFPGQGSGRMSEFAQEAPLWSRQPYKIFYFIYFGLSVGFVFLPWFAIVSIFPSKRERPSWTWKKSTLIKLYRHGTRLTFRTHTSLSRDLTKEVPHSKTVRAKFVWVEGLSEDFVRGELKRMLEIQGLSTVRTCGFWYGERDGGGGVGHKASQDEKVIYHLHGGAYWIGTAHEDDVTSAVNVQVLKALDQIYSNRLPSSDEVGKKEIQTANGQPSPHPPEGGPGAGSGGVCKRAFSLDYRLCVPGRPEVGSFPAPLADAVAGYRYLVNECDFEPKNIIVAGDSAGGNLALALCRYLRDEKLDGLKVPGAMLLLSPWADTSRSHSGPISRPNTLDSVWRNRKSDIIANSAAFRNTAVSALLGKMPARETYRNPYLSSISLQLDAKNGGVGPSYGFEGFPKRIYICTGTAEISHDQHLTLAYRLAAGTTHRVPIHEGDKCSEEADPYEMAARLQYPRPENHEVTIWPSAQNTPIATPMSDDSRSWEGRRVPGVNKNGKMENQQKGGSAVPSSIRQDTPEASEKNRKQLSEQVKSASGAAFEVTMSALEAVSSRLKNADGYVPRISRLKSEGINQTSGERSSIQRVDGGIGSNTDEVEAGEGKNSSKVKEKDTANNAHTTHREAERKDEANDQSSTTFTQLPQKEEELRDDEVNENGRTNEVPPTSSFFTPFTQPLSRAGGQSQSYFDLGGEDRSVVLDESIDAIHDFTLFDWFEPERGQTWGRIAKWIDEDI